MNKGILIISPFFSPDIGGVSTHLDDLVLGLAQKKYKVYVCTHKPLGKGAKKYIPYENINNKIFIHRYWWFGFNLFDKLQKYPFLQFLYITPYLLIRTFFWMLLNHKKINTIHCHGFSGAFIGICLKPIFKKRVILSTHAIYEYKKNSRIIKNITLVLKHIDHIICLSNGSLQELLSYGIPQSKLSVFKYWIDLNIFKPKDKEKIRKELKIKSFTVLFVGRFLQKKGIDVLTKVAINLPQIMFLFVGAGPEDQYIKKQSQKFSNIKIINYVPNNQLYKYYNAADLLCIPSLYEEGFGRVVMESVACNLPVIASNKGSIKEAIDKSVSIILKPDIQNITKAIKNLYSNKTSYLKLKNNCRKFAEKHFSKENIDLITKYYE